MSSATRDWSVTPDGGIALELSVVVNGEKVAVRSVSGGRDNLYGATPHFKYIERELRCKLMRFVEDRLLGPAP